MSSWTPPTSAAQRRESVQRLEGMRRFDSNPTGRRTAGEVIDTLELRASLQYLGEASPDEEELAMLSRLFNERLTLHMRLKNSDRQHTTWISLFKALDRDASGYITYDELRHVARVTLSLTASQLSESRLQALWCLLDIDASNAILMEEIAPFLSGQVKKLLDPKRQMQQMRPSSSRVHKPSLQPPPSPLLYRLPPRRPDAGLGGRQPRTSPRRPRESIPDNMHAHEQRLAQCRRVVADNRARWASRPIIQPHVPWSHFCDVQTAREDASRAVAPHPRGVPPSPRRVPPSSPRSRGSVAAAIKPNGDRHAELPLFKALVMHPASRPHVAWSRWIAEPCSVASDWRSGVRTHDTTHTCRHER